jgi:acetylornithine deacetylase
VSYPAVCHLDYHVQYLPEQADERGYGSLVQREFEDWLAKATETDRWLSEHRPRVEWRIGGVPPAQVREDEPVVQAALSATDSVGRPGRLSGFDNWHDGATLLVEGQIPAVCLGPGDIHLAHTTEERLPIDDLVACAQSLAVTAIRFCGISSRRSRDERTPWQR